ncbi:hypothetical protein XELAEV_180407321mg, partial [Xenopus laevis]
AAARPVLSFSPNWTPILTGDSVTLTCNGAPPAQGNEKYSWYRDNNPIPGEEQQNYIIQRAQREHSGRYQCQISERSVALQLTVSDDSAILQAPPSVHEGDLLILRFRTRPEYDASITTVYFQNKAVMQSLGSHPQFNLGRAQTSMSGSYKCQTNLYEKAEELFSIPQIKVSPDQVTEGDHMTITCDTNLSPHRETTELQLAFYRNGHNVQGFSLSNQYGVPSAQLEDSGNYTCEVQTPTGSVRKMSSIWDFQLQGSSIKPFVSFEPNWATVFTKESVTLTCNVDPPEPRDQIYYWYRDNQIIPLYLGRRRVKIDHVKQEHGGRYQCQTLTSDKSEPVRLQVAHSWLTLKVPMFVFEGDELYVSCAGYPGYSARDAVLYKDNEVIGSSPSDADFLVGRANMTTSELFSKPVMKVNPNHPTEGDHMTITCDTKLSPHRETTELQFVFYRNGHKVQGFSLSNQYGVPSAQLEDSGNYTCEVRTNNNTVRKTSDEISVQMAELFTVPQIKVSSDQVTEGDHMTITCDTKLSPHRETTELQFVFYRNGHNVQGFSLSNQYGVPSAQLEDSGNYTCEVQTPTGSVRKRSNVSHIHIQGAAARPVISFSPNWTPILAGDNVTLTCNGAPPAQGNEKYSWYRDNNPIPGEEQQNYIIQRAQQREH